MSKQQQKIIKKDVGNYSALEAVKSSEGGKLLIASLKQDILSGLSDISGKYLTAKHSELIAICAKISANLSLFRAIMRSSKAKKLALAELDLILAEVEDEDA